MGVVHDSNDVAKNLYRKMGFEKVGEIIDGVCLDDEYKDVLIFGKKLE